MKKILKWIASLPWKEAWKAAAQVIVPAAIGAGVVGLTGCSSLLPENKTQSMGVNAFGIPGSVPSIDSELSGDNSFKVTFTANASVNAELAALVPVNDADQLSVKIESVEDVATHEGKIKGTANFILTGKNMSATRTDESLAIISETGAVVSNVTVVGESDGLGQRIIAKLATALPRGVYRLRLITKGYTAPSADPITYVKKVEVA